MTVVIITVCRISTVTVVMTNSLQDQYRDSGYHNSLQDQYHDSGYHNSLQDQYRDSGYDEQSAGSVP